MGDAVRAFDPHRGLAFWGDRFRVTSRRDDLWTALMLWAEAGTLLRRPVGGNLYAVVPSAQVYVAIPVTSHVREGTEAVVIGEAGRYSAELLLAGCSPVCPGAAFLAATASATAIQRARLAGWDHGDWMSRCYPILIASRAVAIAPAAGWDQSLGVWLEAVAALALNMPLIVPEDMS